MKLLFSLALAVIAVLPQFSDAAKCPSALNPSIGDTRYVDVSPSASCAGIGGNPKLKDINNAFADNWEYISYATGDESLGIDITAGGWGQRNTAGEFSIVDQFWDDFDQAIISIHVGHGRDKSVSSGFMFLIDENTTVGEFATYCDPSGTGCGLSNVKLWGVNTISGGPMPPSAVPVPAAAWLFGSALLSLGLFKRKRT
ncbi:MAG: VPLPA-CTERM sorting domain-containing protein [Halioglobus sp.]